MIRYNEDYKQTQGPRFAISRTELHPFSESETHTNLHYHSDIELLLVDTGESVMQVGDEIVSAAAGSFILVNPYEVHGGETFSREFAHRCICFDPSLLGLPDEESLLTGRTAYEHHIPSATALIPHFNACYEAVRTRQAGWDLQARGNLLLLFSALTERHHHSTSTKDQLFLRDVLDYLEGHFAEELSSAKLAKVFSYEHSYFCRKFHRLFGKSFTVFLQIFRINKAKDFLSTHSISETATLCGFSSISYFSRVFNTITGTTPSQYKKSTQSR